MRVPEKVVGNIGCSIYLAHKKKVLGYDND